MQLRLLRGAKDRASGGSVATPRLGRSGLKNRSTAFIIVLGGGVTAHGQRLEYSWFPAEEVFTCRLVTGSGDLGRGAT